MHNEIFCKRALMPKSLTHTSLSWAIHDTTFHFAEALDWKTSCVRYIHYEKFYVMGYNALQSGKSHPTFQRNISHEVNRKHSLLWLLPASVSFLIDPYTLKMEAIYYSEKSVDFHRTVPEDGRPYCHQCENCKSNLHTLSSSPRLGVGEVGRLPTHHKNI
jgi:hypothetical protein